MFDLNGKTALVTGASGGIGGAIARVLHGAGATVALSGTRRDALDSLAAALGERAFAVPADLNTAAGAAPHAKDIPSRHIHPGGGQHGRVLIADGLVGREPFPTPSRDVDASNTVRLERD